MPRTPYSQGSCANCGAHRVLKYAHRTICCRYACQKVAAAQRRARLADGGADDAVAPTFCYKIEAVLGMRCCDPEQLIAKKRRNKLAAADKTICYLTRGTFKEDQHDTGFTDTRWVELEELYEKCGGKAPLNRALKKYRDMEQGALRQLPSVRRALTNEHVQSIRDYIVCRRVDRTAFLRNVQRIAECIVHFFLIEELVAEDDQLVIVD